MRISVALCTHNGARYVAEQVQSILDQTLPPDELVLSDDASTDDTVAIVRAALAGHPHIDLIVFENNPALRVTRNFEQAVLACTGDLIALSDQDDRWMPDRLERIAEVFAARPDVLLVHSDARLVDDAGAPLGATLFEVLGVSDAEIAAIDEGRAFDALLRRNLVTGATTVLRGSLVRYAAPFPTSWVHDEWLAIIASIVGRTVVLREPLIDYRQHGGNQIGAARLSLMQKVRKLAEPRENRNRGLVARAADLLERVERLAERGELRDGDVVGVTRGKLAHERGRYALPQNRLARIPFVVRSLAGRRYARYSRGVLDVVRDLVQPAG